MESEIPSGYEILCKFLKYICSILISIPFVMGVIFLCTPLYAFRIFVRKVVLHWYPEVDELLAARSSAFAGSPVYEPERPRAAIISVYILKGTVNLEYFRKLFITRVINVKIAEGKFRKPELQQYLTKVWGFFCWKWEQYFDISEHIKMCNGNLLDEFARGDKPVNAEAVVAITDELLYSCFQAKKSPWEIHFLHNYKETDQGSKSTVIIVKHHHALGDGFSILKMFLHDLLQSKQIETALVEPENKGQRRLFIKTVEFCLTFPFEMFTEFVCAMDFNSWHVSEKRLKRALNSGISKPISMDYLKEVKNSNNVTFTTLIIACFTAAVRKFMIEAGFDVPKSIHCLTPLPFPGHPEKLCNHMTACIATLPVGISDHKERLKAIEKNLKHLKTSTFPIAAFKLLPLNSALPSWLLPFIQYNFLTTAMMSNFPGPSTAIRLDEHVFTDIWFCTGFLHGNTGMGFTSLSYNGHIRILASIDEGIVPKSHLPVSKLIDYFMEEVEILRREATDTDQTTLNYSEKHSVKINEEGTASKIMPIHRRPPVRK